MPIVAVDANLSTLDVELPRTHTGIVLAQPHLELTPQEPYRCTEQSKRTQLEAIDASLEVARTARHGAGRTHFTIFPEYSIPAPEGIERLERALREEDWPAQTIVIGGTDGLSATEYSELAEAPGTHVDMEHNNPADIPAGQWINCAIVWAKAANGTVERWLQPKLYPSWPEQDVTDSTMFRGGSIFTFRGRFNDDTPYRFSVLVCYDWIATVGGETPWRAMVDETIARSNRPRGRILAFLAVRNSAQSAPVAREFHDRSQWVLQSHGRRKCASRSDMSGICQHCRQARTRKHRALWPYEPHPPRANKVPDAQVSRHVL